MATAVNTGSTLTFPGGQNRTSTGISTNILITVQTPRGPVPVGAVQSLQITEARNIKMIDEIGTDGHVDSVPNQSTNITGNCQRIRFDRLRVAEAFSRGFVHVQSQAYPFNIVIFDNQTGTADQTTPPGTQISTIIQNVWIRQISYTYSATDWIITDNMDWEAETILSVLNGGNPVAQGGERSDIIFNGGAGGTNGWIERETDTGANGRRGSLDAPGLIDLGATTILF